MRTFCHCGSMQIEEALKVAVLLMGEAIKAVAIHQEGLEAFLDM